MLGQLGKAALAPIYARAHGLSDNDNKVNQLNGPLRSALLTLKTLLEDVQPRRIPKQLQSRPFMIYTDAHTLCWTGSSNRPVMGHFLQNGTKPSAANMRMDGDTLSTIKEGHHSHRELFPHA